MSSTEPQILSHPPGTAGKNTLLAVTVLLTVVILAADLSFPREVASGVAYIVVVLIAARFPDRRATLIVAVICSGLMLLEAILTAPRDEIGVQFANRGLALTSLWVCAALLYQYRRNADALATAEAKIRWTLNHIPALLHSVDRQGRLLNVSEQWLVALGYERSEVIGRPFSDFMTEESRRHATEVLLPEYLLTGTVNYAEIQLARKDGGVIDVLLCAIGERNELGGIEASLTVMFDITARKEAEAALHEEKERAQITLRSIGDAVITTDRRGRVQYLNPVAEFLTGWFKEQAKGKPIGTVFRAVHETTGERTPDPVARCLNEKRTVAMAEHSVLVSRGGMRFAVEDTAAPIRDRGGRIVGAVLVFHDVTESRRLAREVAYQASHDALTGLVNRREFERHLEHALEATDNSDVEHVLCFMDLDQFKVVNDTCGHMAGDELLRQLRLVFEAHVRQHDTLARLGGDEFALLLEHCPLAQAIRVANELRVAIDEYRFTWENNQFHIGMSIGIVPISSDSGTAPDLLRNADAACYTAKERGRNRIHVYRPGDSRLKRRHGDAEWAVRIQHALKEGLFTLYAQPIACVAAGRATDAEFYEVLLRLDDRSGDLVRPGMFLPAVERYNLVGRLDRWVLQHTLDTLAASPAFLDRLGICFINLSGPSLVDDELLEFAVDAIERGPVPPHKIGFEITESAAVGNLSAALHFIDTLRNRGCTFSLDDFGSGLSSFAYLKNLPVQYLKMDGAFVKDIATDPIDHAMVKSIHEVAKVMGIHGIAEFVESAAVLDRLRDIGVEYAQGYAIGHPCPISEIMRPPGSFADSVTSGARGSAIVARDGAASTPTLS